MVDVAAFDFDGTLTNGGSVIPFLADVTSLRQVAAATLPLVPQLVHAALSAGPTADAVKERVFERVLAGVTTEQLESTATGFAPRHLTRQLRPEVRRRLDWHRERGDHVVVVSASPEVYVRPAAIQLGAEAVLATRLEVRDGVLTGRYEGSNCRGEEKVRRFDEWVASLDEQPGRVWAYGNSRGDLRLLGMADIGVNVGRLGRLGRLRAFPSLDRVRHGEVDEGPSA